MNKHIPFIPVYGLALGVDLALIWQLIVEPSKPFNALILIGSAGIGLVIGSMLRLLYTKK